MKKQSETTMQCRIALQSAFDAAHKNKMNTPDTEKLFQKYVCANEYIQRSVQFTVKQGARGEEKETVHITMHGVPRPEDFPGGNQWKDDEGESVENPFFTQWMKYQKDHEIAAQRRDGESEFWVFYRPIVERGPVKRKPATAVKEMDNAMERDPEETLKALAAAYARRKGIEYSVALEKMRADWAE